MAFQRPTLDQLIDRVKTDIKGGLGITTVLRRSFINVISRALGGLAHLLFGFLAFIAEQVFPDTAIGIYLERWSSFWGIDRKVATFTELNITVTGNEGGTVPVSTTYQRPDGVQYLTDVEVTIPVGLSIVVKVIAVDAGSNGNLDDGETLTLLSPIANVDSDALVLETVIEGENTEEDEPLRARLVARVQQAPLGGSANDYIQTALAVAGVTRAWVIPLNRGAGTVDVTFVEDDDLDIVPDAPKLAEVQAAIDEFKPVTADSIVFAPVLAPATMNIKIKPNTASVQEAITKELDDLMLRDGQIVGSFKDAAGVYDGKILLSKIQTAIGIATGLDNYEIQTINLAAPADIEPTAGQLVTLGVITWQPLA